MSDQKVKFSTTLQTIDQVARDILAFGAEERVWLFYGSMGAGKTTLIKSICAAMGIKDAVSSPTFSIINEYRTDSRSVFHFDFYRLKDQTEAMDMGYEEYFYSGNYCLIEWPEKIPDLLPNSYLTLNITIIDPNTREIIVERHDL